MKILAIICFLVAALAWHDCPAQSLVKVKKKRKFSSPISLFSKSKTLIEKGNWMLCADAAYNKNSLPCAPLDNNLLVEYNGSLPVYGSYRLNKDVALEGGAYWGVSAHRADFLGIEPLPHGVDRSFKLRLDSGLVTGLSFDLKEFGKLKMRYNYGLSNLMVVEDRSLRTRRLDIGLSFQF